jgi:hypothetical protein
MSGIQPAAAFRRTRVGSHDRSIASIADSSIEAPTFADTLLLARPKATVDAKALARRVTAAWNTTKLQYKALDWLETRASRAASGDNRATEELAAVISVLKLIVPEAAPSSSPDVTQLAGSKPAVQASTSAAAPTPLVKSEPDTKKTLTTIEKIVKFGDCVDKALKPVTQAISTCGSITTILTNLGVTL